MLYPNQLNIITYKDTAPVMIEDKEGAIDRVGFKKARKKMDEAHNNMINTKYQLAIYTQFPSDLRADHREERGPLADVVDSSPRRHIPTQEDLQRAIDSPSYADPEYRKVAKEYLEKILPAVNAERDRLTEEIASAAAELEAVTLEYKEKLGAAKRNLKNFNRDVFAEYKKFEEAGKGSHTPENFVITSERYKPILGFYTPSVSEAPEALEAVLETMEKYEESLKFRKSDAHTELQKEYMRSAAAARTMGATEARGNVNAEGIDFDGRKAAPKNSYFFKFFGK